MSKQVVVDAATAKLGTERVGRLLLDYSIPAIIGMVATSLYNIVDRIFIGQGVGAVAISGLALTFPLMTLVAAIGTLIGVGASTRMSIVLGMKDIKWARNILGNAFILTFVLSAILITVSMIFMNDILVAFGGSEQTIPYAEKYLNIVIPGSFLTNLSYSFSGVMRSAGYPKKSMYTILIGVAANVILDPILIFGFGMGIQGAAIATVISMAAGAIFVLSHFFNKKHAVHFEFKCFRPKRFIIRNIVSIGLAPFLMNVAASAVNIILNNRLVIYGGDLAIGAFGIVNSYGILVVMTVMGLCQGMQPIIGYNYGAQKTKRMKDTLKLTIKVSSVIMVIGWACCEIFPKLLVGAFTSDDSLSEMAATGLRIANIVLPLVGFQIVVSNFFMSISKVKQSIFMSLSRQVIFLIPSLYLFSEWFGLTGIWFAIPVSDSLAAVIAVIFLINEKKVFYPRKAL